VCAAWMLTRWIENIVPRLFFVISRRNAMNDSNKPNHIIATVAGVALGLLAAIVVVFMGVQSWDIRTVVYSAAGAAIVVGGLVYVLLNRYFANRTLDDD
jgi:hypothetical protein